MHCLKLVFILIIASQKCLAAQESIAFYFSNSTSTISLSQAFCRLCSKDQVELQKTAITLMRQEHINKIELQDLLGFYRIYKTKNMTADNSEKLVINDSPQLSSKKAFKIAGKLANALNQESVAIFLPDDNMKGGQLIIRLMSHQYTIQEITNIIHKKLPKQYNQGFSLHLKNPCYASFEDATVEEVEWLGTKIKQNDVKKLFPQDNVTYHLGRAYLVYSDGKKQSL